MAKSKPQNRSGVPLGLYVPPALAAALDAYVEASKPRTNKTGVIVMLLERFLEEQGHWPPAAPAEGK